MSDDIKDSVYQNYSADYKGLNLIGLGLLLLLGVLCIWAIKSSFPVVVETKPEVTKTNSTATVTSYVSVY